jgi:hypothetical protein
VYFRAADGSEPVREFIAELEANPRAALKRQIDRLNDLSDAMPHLPFPHSSQVEGELRSCAATWAPITIACSIGARSA